ncbi:MAG: hypothetical protein WCL50_03650, partial [Spirochaetota bacterium]
MKSGNLRRALVTGLVYLAVFIGLVLLQFSSSSGLAWKPGIMSITSNSTKPQSEKPEKFQISFSGLRISIDKDHQASAVYLDGTTKALTLLSAAKDGAGVTVGFSRDLRLAIKTRGAGADQVAEFKLTCSDAQVAGIRLAYELVAGSSLSGGDSSALVSGSRGSISFSLPASSFRAGKFMLPVSDALVVRSQAPLAKTKSTLVVRTDVEFRQGIIAWIDKAWGGLNESRLDPASLTWKGMDSSKAFSELALVAWLSESFRRGLGEAALEKARSVKEKYSGQLSYLSAPYLGNTFAKMSVREANDAVEAKRFALLVQVGDATVLESPDLVRRIVDRTSPGFYQDVIRFISGLD